MITAGRPPYRTMSIGGSLIGTGTLGRLSLRLDRLWWPVWVALLVLIAVATPSTYEQLYPDPAQRAGLTAQISANSSLLTLTGPAYDLSTTGGFTSWRILGFLATAGGLAALMSVIRHTRVEEETGRMEVLRSGVLGRHAALGSALLELLAWSLAIGTGVLGGLLAAGLPVAGSALFAAEVVATMWCFGGIGALAAQLTAHARTARAIAGGVLGGAYLMRAVADAADIGWLGWATPLGWPHRAQPFVANRWWVLLLSVLVAGGATAAAVTLENRRDVGSGMLQSTLGPARGRLGSVGDLVGRLQRPTLGWWVVGVAVFALVLGAVTPGITELLAGNPGMADLLRQMGGAEDLVLTFVGAMLPILTAVGALYGVGAVARLDGEEQDGRAELLLSTPVPRVKLFLAHLGWAVGGTVLLAAVAGLGIVGGYVLGGGPDSLAGQVLAGALG